MNSELVDFENFIKREPPEACKVLGVAYSTYAQYRSELRKLPKYHRNHIKSLKLVPSRALDRLIAECIDER